MPQHTIHLCFLRDNNVMKMRTTKMMMKNERTNERTNIYHQIRIKLITIVIILELDGT
jgi:hypothetical protein